MESGSPAQSLARSSCLNFSRRIASASASISATRAATRSRYCSGERWAQQGKGLRTKTSSVA